MTMVSLCQDNIPALACAGWRTTQSIEVTIAHKYSNISTEYIQNESLQNLNILDFPVFLSLFTDTELNILVRISTPCCFISQCNILDKYPSIWVHHDGGKYKSLYEYIRFYNDIGQKYVAYASLCVQAYSGIRCSFCSQIFVVQY